MGIAVFVKKICPTTWTITTYNKSSICPGRINFMAWENSKKLAKMQSNLVFDECYFTNWLNTINVYPLLFTDKKLVFFENHDSVPWLIILALSWVFAISFFKLHVSLCFLFGVVLLPYSLSSWVWWIYGFSKQTTRGIWNLWFGVWTGDEEFAKTVACYTETNSYEKYSRTVVWKCLGRLWLMHQWDSIEGKVVYKEGHAMWRCCWARLSLSFICEFMFGGYDIRTPCSNAHALQCRSILVSRQ